MHVSTTRMGVAAREQVKPEDVRDAVSTLSFNNKIVVHLPPPGLGPMLLLEWAQRELAESVGVSCDPASV